MVNPIEIEGFRTPGHTIHDVALRDCTLPQDVYKRQAYGSTERGGRWVMAALFQKKLFDLLWRRRPGPLCKAEEVGALDGA